MNEKRIVYKELMAIRKAKNTVSDEWMLKGKLALYRDNARDLRLKIPKEPEPLKQEMMRSALEFVEDIIELTEKKREDIQKGE